MNDLFKGDNVLRKIPDAMLNMARETAQLLREAPQACIIGPGDARCWTCDPNFDELGKELLAPFREQGLPIFNPVEIDRVVSHRDKWHFDKASENKTHLVRIIACSMCVTSVLAKLIGARRTALPRDGASAERLATTSPTLAIENGNLQNADAIFEDNDRAMLNTVRRARF